jgi:methylglutaconyl-CoA hydratase
MDKVQDLVRLERDARGVATLALNRPDRHNALSAPLVGALTAALERRGGHRRDAGCGRRIAG